ncbi:MAG: DNA-processing protein DprA [Alphaproteobacteria bacterium]
MILTDQQKKEWIQLALCENVGPMTFRNLMAYFGSAKEAITHLNDFARRGGRTRPIVAADEKQAEAQLNQAEQIGAQILASCEDSYPRLLKTLEDTPPLLFCKGHLSLTKKESFAIVGTRNASVNGRIFTKKLAADLTQHDYVITSGMARGIDTAAHEGALSDTSGQGGTIAVMGTPLDEIYPLENKKLFEQICERGCVLSEQPFGAKTSPQNFPRRNRIISGLSRGVVIVEAQGKSGSLITARLAARQNRLLFAVPGFPLDPRSEGPNKLIKSGAFLLEDATDIIRSSEDLTTRLQFDEIPVEEMVIPSYPSVTDQDLQQARQIIRNSLSAQMTDIDELIRELDLPVQIVNIVLVELELAGRIERLPGNRVSLLFEG